MDECWPAVLQPCHLQRMRGDTRPCWAQRRLSSVTDDLATSVEAAPTCIYPHRIYLQYDLHWQQVPCQRQLLHLPSSSSWLPGRDIQGAHSCATPPNSQLPQVPVACSQVLRVGEAGRLDLHVGMTSLLPLAVMAAGLEASRGVALAAISLPQSL